MFVLVLVNGCGAGVGLGIVVWGVRGVGRACSAHSCLRLPVAVAVCVSVRCHEATASFTAARSCAEHYQNQTKKREEELRTAPGHERILNVDRFCFLVKGFRIPVLEREKNTIVKMTAFFISFVTCRAAL